MFTKEQAKEIGDKLGVDWNQFDLKEFHMGMDIELEHGIKYPKWNVTNDCPIKTAKIALAHLEEIQDYYTRLKRMEEEAGIKENVITSFLRGN